MKKSFADIFFLILSRPGTVLAILGVDRSWAGHERVTGLLVTSGCPGYMVSELGELGSVVLDRLRLEFAALAACLCPAPRELQAALFA